MHPYVLKRIISEHDGSINSLAFSQDGSLFASGGNDGLVIVFEGHGSGQEIHRFRVKAPVTTLLWHSLFDYAVLAGDASGFVHIIGILKDSMINNPNLADRVFAPNSIMLSGPIHCMVQNDFLLAIGAGKFVHLIKKETLATWKSVALLPDPPGFPELEGELREPIARSLHFLQDNENTLLLVTYLEHGVIAWDLKTYKIIWRIRPRSKIGHSALSPGKETLAVMNLHDGIDWYALSGDPFMGALFLHNTSIPTLENVILPVTFIYGGSAVLSGTSYGCARITDAMDWTIIGTLSHNTEDIVQALGYSCSHGVHQMVTGIAERQGSKPVIRYWIQDQRLNTHEEPGTRAKRDQVHADPRHPPDHALRKCASAMALIVLGLAILATSWKWNTVDLLYYYNRVWPTIKTFFGHWLKMEM